MTEIVDAILRTYGKELDAEARAKISRYLETLTSTGKKDDLTVYGLAYLEQLDNPDPRYSGC
jgi:predicted SpoU family rRNA methylase